MLRDLRQAGLPCIIDAMALGDPYRIACLSADADVDVIVSNLGYTYEAEVIALARAYPRLYFDAGRVNSPDGTHPSDPASPVSELEFTWRNPLG